ncbi:MAG: carboxylesterase family protein, partial [Propionibacteriaceae bacterium]|nr:carboxylesterase family protein [Propionibacteriaceae bacterium]
DAAEAEGEQWLAEHGVSTLAAARALPLDRLLVGNDADEAGTTPHRPPLFRPVLDGWVFPRSYAETLQLGAQADIPVMTGTNADEDGAEPHPFVTPESFRAHARAEYGDLADEFLSLYPADDAPKSANAAARELSRTSTYLWTRLWAEHASSLVYSYYWTHAAPGPDAELRGAFHGCEIWYFLDSLAHTDRPWTADDWRIAETMSGYVVRFVTTGDPNGSGAPEWAPAGAEPRTMELGDRFGALEVAPPERFDFNRRFLVSRPLWR